MAGRDDGRHEIRHETPAPREIQVLHEIQDPHEIRVLHEIQVLHEFLHSSRSVRQSQAETGSVTAVLPDKARDKGTDKDRGTDRVDMGDMDKGKAVG